MYFDLFFCAFLDFSILFLIVLYQYLCHCQLDTSHKGVVVIPVVQSETELIHILLQVFHGNYEIYCRPPFEKRLVNSKYVIFVYVVCSHYKDTIFREKTKSKVDNSVKLCFRRITLCFIFLKSRNNFLKQRVIFVFQKFRKVIRISSKLLLCIAEILFGFVKIDLRKLSFHLRKRSLLHGTCLSQYSRELP